MDNIQWLLGILHNALETNGAFVVAVGTFLLGENAALAAFALSAQGYINPIKAVIYVFIGSMAADVFWFFMTEYVLRPNYEGYLVRRLKKAENNENEKFLLRLIDKHFFWVLVFIKFLPGMRLVLTIYIVLKNRIPFHKKVLIDAVGTVLFLFLLFPVGWFFGKGASAALDAQRGISIILSMGVFVILFVVLLPRVIIFVLKHVFKDKELK